MDILLADDTEDNHLLVRAFLKGIAVSVHSASTGCEAAELARKRHFPLILMDVNMPQMNGLEATTAIRADEAAHSARPSVIVALSADAMNETRQRALVAGCDEYMTKPIDRLALRARVERALANESAGTVHAAARRA